MAGRVGTANLDLGTWPLGVNPGAGPQNVSETDPTLAGQGSNGDQVKIDIAVGTQHNRNGTHKDAVIDAASLKSTTVDGSTLIQDASTKKLRIKNSGDGTPGVATANIQDAAVTNAKLATNAVTQSKIDDAAVGTNELIDSAVTTAKIADVNVTGAKISHDNTRTKQFLTFTLKGIVNGTWAYYGDTQLNSNLGVPMPRAGRMLRFVVKDNSASGSTIFNAGGTGLWADGIAFNAGDYLGMHVGVTNILHVTVNGSETGVLYDDSFGGTTNIFVTVEIELT